MLSSLSRTLRDIHRLSREAPTPAFQDAAFDTLKKMIRFDSGFWGGGRGPVENVTLHYVHLHRVPPEIDSAFEASKSRPRHVEAISRCVGNAGRAFALDTREAGIDDLYAPYGIDQFVTLYHHDADLGLYHVISLYRKGTEKFTEQECRLFENAVPHLLDAWQENRLLHLLPSSRQGLCPPPAAALVDKEGVVHSARHAYVELMRQEWPEWHGPHVPEAVRNAENGTFAGARVTIRLTPQHDFYLATIRQKGPVDQLTLRERIVAEHLAKGASHKEIAGMLAIAPATVRNHIAHIHSKLGTSKGAQVATILLGQETP